eukprot:16261048-Heterocapsa_arctica.AAC.1
MLPITCPPPWGTGRAHQACSASQSQPYPSCADPCAQPSCVGNLPPRDTGCTLRASPCAAAASRSELRHPGYVVLARTRHSHVAFEPQTRVRVAHLCCWSLHPAAPTGIISSCRSRRLRSCRT